MEKIGWHSEPRKLSELKEWDKNPRTLKQDGLENLKNSIDKFGLAEPIIINTDNLIIGGHARFKVLIGNGAKECDCYIPNRTLTGDEVAELNIRLNANIAGEFDFDILASDWDADLLVDWGLDLPLDFETEEAKEDNYQIPDEIKTDIVLGDLIEIGNNRLLCGDAKDSDAVARLMDNQLADLVVTDPPYNTGMKGNKENAKAWLSQMFDDSFTDSEFKELMTESFNNYNLFTKGECALYVFIDWRRVGEMRQYVENIAVVKNVIVWDKGVHGLGSDYKSVYENIIVGKKGSPQINNRIGLDYQDIWRVQRKMGRDKDHATKKPIELLNKPILHASKEDDIVMDLFGGSGSTMVTSEQLKRKAYLLELKPVYCQVIIDRMTKLNPNLPIKVNGKEYK